MGRKGSILGVIFRVAQAYRPVALLYFRDFWYAEPLAEPLKMYL